jgi:hypothetical protein
MANDHHRDAFSLTKWYFDCTSSDGRTAVGYCASLDWRRLSLTWQALSLWDRGELSMERSIIAAGSMPWCGGDRIGWSATRLGCDLAARRLVEPADILLFEHAGGCGCVKWRCEAPSAEMTLEMAGRPRMRGAGYVERIQLTLPPWRLPIRELRWGRWIDDDANHSVVWIDWRGPEPRTWLLVDGVVTSHADVQDGCVVAGPAVLTLDRRSTLSTRSLADILGRFAPLRAVVPSSLMSLRQVKWQSRGMWRRHGSGRVSGTAIHEWVVFHDNRDDL